MDGYYDLMLFSHSIYHFCGNSLVSKGFYKIHDHLTSWLSEFMSLYLCGWEEAWMPTL